MRFAVISDTHLYVRGNGKDSIWWNRMLRSQTDRISSCMIDTISPMQPDFVVHCGDISGHCDLENFRTGLAILDRLPCPWYAVLGNHDTWFPGVRDAFSERNGLPHGQCYYSVSLGGLRFIFLDTCYWRATDGSASPYLDKQLFDSNMINGLYIDDEELEWLDTQLKTYSQEKVVLVSHAPLGFKDNYKATTLPDGQPGRPEGCSLLEFNTQCGIVGDIHNRLELRALLARHPNVKMAFAGHCHINDYHREQGIAFIQTGSMIEYPFEFRLVEIDNGVASFTTHGLNDPSFQKESFIEERGNRWLAGKDAERTFTVAL